MKITILCVGKLKEPYYRDAVAEFEKRLGRYCKLEIIQVADERTPDGASEAEEERIRRVEGERLRRHFRDDAYICALDVRGEEMDSVAFSRKLEQLSVNGCSRMIFVIGGSLGLERELLEASNFRLSFSKMTFPHQLMRVILLEQIYRCFRIIHHEPYHK